MDEKVKEVIQVAGSLFSRKGIRSVTMTELALACGISKKTLYFHFRDKDHLMLTVIATNFETISKQVIQLKERRQTGNGELDRLFNLIKVQSKIFTPIFLQDLIKYHHRISVLVECRFKRLIGSFIAADDGRNWYEWQLRQIFHDFAIPEDERQDLLDQINANYKCWLSAAC